MTFSRKVIAFNKALGKNIKVSNPIEVLDPFASLSTRKLSSLFYEKFYNDNNPRIFILGINPGRFGAGVTGVPFTDPINLEEFCKIENALDKRHELSSRFVYDFINAFGGVEKFYKDFFITAVCPLGFTKEGKNINYYDDKKLQNEVEPFIIKMMKKQLAFPARREVALILGEGKNFKYFEKLNQELKFFEELIPLAHPRYILQYKRKSVNKYISMYKQKCNLALKKAKS